MESEILDLALRIRKRQPKIGCKKIYRMIEPELRTKRIKYGRDKFLNLLQREGLGVRKSKRRTRTTMSNHNLGVSPNLIKGKEVTKADEVWVSDITYIETREGFMYLSILTDLYSRKILGFKLSEDMSSYHTIETLKMAINNSKSKRGAEIHHSDRGSQYSSKEYKLMLDQHSIQRSMTKGGSPEENAVAERINGILKSEFLISDKKHTKSECKKLVEEAIWIYNNERPHMSLDYQTPSEKYG